MKLFLLHFAGGNRYSFQFLTPYLQQLELYPLELPGRGRRVAEPLLTNFDDAAQDLYAQIVPHLDGDRFLIYGHSMGAYLALRLSHMLEKAGHPPACIFVSGNAGPAVREKSSLYLLEEEEFARELQELGGMPAAFFRDRELFKFFEPILRADFQVIETNDMGREQPVDTPLFAMMGSEEDNAARIDQWGRYTKKFFTYEIMKGHHFFIHDHPGKIASIIMRFAMMLCCLLAGSGLLHAQPAVKAFSGKGDICWDSYGVPHIYAASQTQMYYEFGWAQMHNHADLILRLYGQARGRAAEYWGEQYLESDRQVWLFDMPALARKTYAKSPNAFNPLLDAFVKGMNDFATSNPGMITAALRAVLPVKPEDVLAHGMRVVFLRFVASETLGMASRTGKPGSNAAAIAPSRSVSGKALLLANPHLPWGDLFTFFEAQLESPGFSAYGASIVGMPVLNIAFNDKLGWTHTVNATNASTRYELRVHDDRYRLDSAWIPFTQKRILISVRQADGTMRQDTFLCRYARHGPVTDIRGDKAYAIRIAGLENPDIFLQWHRMGAAKDLPAFQSALKMMQLPMFNIIYADARGNIFYLFDGNIPAHDKGDWKYWSTVVDGSSSGNIWENTLPYHSLPSLLNPSTGFIQNANDAPWSCTWPTALDPLRYPPFIPFQPMSLRAQRAIKLLKDEHRLDLDALTQIKLNNGVEAADRWLPALIKAVGDSPDSLTTAAIAVLKSWDRHTDSGSRGAVLFIRWFDKLNDRIYDRQWDPAAALETPAGLKDPAGAVSLLRTAAVETARDYGSLAVAWGDVYRFRWGPFDYPANGGPGQYGVYRTIYFAPDKDKKYRSVAGDGYVAITEFGDTVHARVLLSYGNATQPGSRHLGDQLLLLSRKAMRDALLRRDAVLADMEEHTQF